MNVMFFLNVIFFMNVLQPHKTNSIGKCLQAHFEHLNIQHKGLYEN